MLCRLSLRDAQAAASLADKAVAAAERASRGAQHAASQTNAKLLARCPHVDRSLAVPLISAFTLNLDHVSTIEECSLALSLCFAPARDVLLVPTLADVSRCVRHEAVLFAFQWFAVCQIVSSSTSYVMSRVACLALAANVCILPCC